MMMPSTGKDTSNSKNLVKKDPFFLRQDLDLGILLRAYSTRTYVCVFPKR
jgi:hypothetical protein